MTPEQEIERENILDAAHQNYEKSMHSYAFFKVRSRETVQDLVQDTFVKTWRYLVKGGKIDLMKSFLYHILNQLIIDEYRKRKTYSLDLLVEKGFDQELGDSGRIVDAFDGKTALFLIHRLPLKYKKVMRMRYAQNLSIKEISLITGQSRNAVAVQAHRGLAKLKLLFTRA